MRSNDGGGEHRSDSGFANCVQRLLVDARADALAVEYDTLSVDGNLRNRRDPNSEAEWRRRMIAGADDLDRLTDRLSGLRSDSSLRQQREIDSILPMLRQIVLQIRSLSNMLSKNVDVSNPALFRDCITEASDLESRTALKIGTFLMIAPTRKSYSRPRTAN